MEKLKFLLKVFLTFLLMLTTLSYSSIGSMDSGLKIPTVEASTGNVVTVEYTLTRGPELSQVSNPIAKYNRLSDKLLTKVEAKFNLDTGKVTTNLSGNKAGFFSSDLTIQPVEFNQRLENTWLTYMDFFNKVTGLDTTQYWTNENYKDYSKLLTNNSSHPELIRTIFNGNSYRDFKTYDFKSGEFYHKYNTETAIRAAHPLNSVIKMAVNDLGYTSSTPEVKPSYSLAAHYDPIALIASFIEYKITKVTTGGGGSNSCEGGSGSSTGKEITVEYTLTKSPQLSQVSNPIAKYNRLSNTLLPKVVSNFNLDTGKVTTNLSGNKAGFFSSDLTIQPVEFNQRLEMSWLTYFEFFTKTTGLDNTKYWTNENYKDYSNLLSANSSHPELIRTIFNGNSYRDFKTYDFKSGNFYHKYSTETAVRTAFPLNSVVKMAVNDLGYTNSTPEVKPSYSLAAHYDPIAFTTSVIEYTVTKVTTGGGGSSSSDCGPNTPPSLTCPTGLVLVGEGSGAYCLKENIINSCTSSVFTAGEYVGIVGANSIKWYPEKKKVYETTYVPIGAILQNSPTSTEKIPLELEGYSYFSSTSEWKGFPNLSVKIKDNPTSAYSNESTTKLNGVTTSQFLSTPENTNIWVVTQETHTSTKVSLGGFGEGFEAQPLKWVSNSTSADCNFSGGGSTSSPGSMTCPPGTTPKPSEANATYCLQTSGQGGTVGPPSAPEIIYPEMSPVDLGIDLNTIMNQLTKICFGNGNNSITNIVSKENQSSNPDKNCNEQGGKTTNNITIQGGQDNKYINLSVNGYDENFVNFTNIPTDGKILSLSDKTIKTKNADGTEGTTIKGWQPEYIISYNGGQILYPKPNNEVLSAQHDKTLADYKNPKAPASNSEVEVIMFGINSLQQLNDLTKNEQSLVQIFDKNSNGKYRYESQIAWNNTTKNGADNYPYLGTNKEGYYLLASKYKDCSKGASSCETSYTYKAIELSFLNSTSYLPLTNNLNGQVNDMFMTLGSKKNDHGFSNLAYKGPDSNYSSMKVPSAYNYQYDYSLIGSPNGGLNLLDKDLKHVALSGVGVNINSLKVNAIEEVLNGFFVACEEGVFFVNALTKQVKKTSITTPTKDLSIVSDLIYALAEDSLTLYYIVGEEVIKTNTTYNLVGAFSDGSKRAGRVDILNGLISVSSKDKGANSELVILSAL